MNKKIQSFFILTICTIVGCSSQKDTFINRLFHNTTAHFNAYYLAKEKISELEKNIKESHQEDFSQVLPIFYPIDSAVIQENGDLIKEARELASKAIDWHKISKWVDPGYFLLGKLDYYQADFDEAMNTFKYLNVNSKQKEVRHLSLIQLLRTFIDLRIFDDAAYVIDFLSKEPDINKENMQYLYKTLAYYYEVRGENDMIVPALNKSLENTDDKKERSRLNFIMGQLYQRAGLDAIAYDYYQKSLNGNPPYERTFFAQLYSQQVVELEKSRDLKRVRNYYDGLYKDRKNIELRDVILYEKALFELNQEELEEAIRLLELAAEEPGNNPKQKGYIYKKLSEIYFEEKKNYQTTKHYVDLALQNFKETDSQFDQLSFQKEVLDEYVYNYELIQRNDSLLQLAQLSPEEQEAFADQYIKKEEERLLREAEEANAPKSTNILNNLLALGGGGSGSGNNFYWDNSLAMQQGAIEFARVWGKRPLEDNWRRSNRSFRENPGEMISDPDSGPELEPDSEEPEERIILPDKESLLMNIPRDSASQAYMNEEMEEAYFLVGKLLFFDLKEPLPAIDYLENLIQKYPETARKPETYYTLYLAAKEVNGNASQYADRLKSEFPESPYTKSLNNPERASGNEANLVSAQNYRTAYRLYAEGEFDASRSLIQQTLNEYSLTKNTEKLMLLDIMISGKLGHTEIYHTRLEKYIQSTADPGLVEMAGNMLSAVTGIREGKKPTEASPIDLPDSTQMENDPVDLEKDQLEKESSSYTFNPDQTHIFILAMDPQQTSEGKNLTADLENFHRQHFPNERLRTGNISFTKENSIIIISPFNNAEKALAYKKEFLKSFNTDSLSEELKMSSFVISIENFQEFNKRKNIEEYKAFYQKSYQ
jgi:tetratricopeptide (TPR) repeat protein